MFRGYSFGLIEGQYTKAGAPAASAADNAAGEADSPPTTTPYQR
jgi:hypothetical protein